MAQGEWSNQWPARPGLYWFYGYPINKEIDVFPRLLLVNIEYTGTYGVRARTLRTTLKGETGCLGYWLPINVPDLPKNLDQLEKSRKGV